jgi:YggT family protein
MGTPYVSDAGEFLIQTAFGLYVLAVMLRFLLQWVRADFYNPVSQFLVKVTSPVLRPLRRVIPGYAGIDFAAIVLMLGLKLVEWWLVLWLKGIAPAAGGVFFLAVADLLSLVVNVFLVAILIQVILSWVNPGAHNPVSSLLWRLNEPLLGPARRLLPPISGLDLSPILVVVVLQLLKYLLVAPVRDLGGSLLQ